MESVISQKTFNVDVEKQKFQKTSLKRKTIVFDFDETLAKVHFNKRELPHYDDQVDILTKDKTISVTLLNYNLIANRYSLVCDLG